ncbi:MAG: glycosyltransferase family 4 protein [Salinarimonas sp.]|nr:glycosyltransferase family 4 protein [Salinarimonas sp.]
MKILIIQKRFHPNSRGIVRGLREAGHDVAMIVHSASKESFPECNPIVVPYIRSLDRLIGLLNMPKLRNRAGIPSLFRLIHAMKATKPDIVVIKKSRLPAIISGLAAVAFGARRILLTNSPPPKQKHRFNLAALLRGTGIITKRRIVTTAGRPGALAEDMVNGARFRPYPIELPEISHRRDNDIGPLRLLMVGKFSSTRKRLPWLIEAAAAAGLSPSDTQITIVGSGQDDSSGAQAVRDAAERLGWAGSLTLRFNLPHDSMGDVYAANDIFVMTARDEPFGMVVVEAMAHGLPVICSDSVGGASCITHDENGLIFPSDSLPGLTEELRRLAASPSERAKLGAAARETIAQKCSPIAFARLIEEVAQS